MKKAARPDEGTRVTAQSPSDETNRQGKRFSHGRRDLLKGVAALAALPLLPQLSADIIAGTEPPAPKTFAGTERERSFDDGWRFFLGDAAGAERPDFDDKSWRLLDVPHDWSIEDLPPRSETTMASAIWGNNIPNRIGPFDADASEGKNSTGFVVGGTGWYR